MTALDNGEDLDIEPGVTGPELEHESVLDRVKKRRRERPDILTLDIPSWGGEMRAEYKLLPRDYVEKMVREIRARRATGKKSDAAREADARMADINFLIKACVGVIAFDSVTEEEQRLADGYVMELAPLLDPKDEFDNPIEIKTEQQLVAYMFGRDDISIPLAAHSMRVARWMQDTSKPVEDPT